MTDKPIREIIFYGDSFRYFYKKQSQKVKKKINWTIGLLKFLEVIPEKYIKHIEETDLYEIRVSFGNNIFRIFCFFDKGRIIIILNGFQKKTQKTPKTEIEKALKLKKEYYENKK
ncbi:MAG: type II toxin-antitoxin system RelE/ParE family toxin [Bacteroidia bacterium]|nr:type II toxin-antitoxin system RelE/ParE family toxin [Bacteroidia bacterium]